LERGLKSFLLFAKARQKDALASESASLEAVLPEAVAVLRKRLGNEFLLFSDVCLCPYTDTGHCGFVKEKRVDNDASVQALARMAVAHAQSGVDFVAPSDMMDGRVAAIRKALDGAGFSDVGVLAYTAKYASAYYGPFREALDSSPQEFNRASYQMDFGNAREAMRELSLDLAEGADLVMVKPALAYLDIIHRFSLESKVPVVAYSVSGEYEATLRLAQAGLADERDLAVENLIAIRRAGAQAVITYFASKAAHERWI
jgi:porphobilinogen synthase